MSNGCSSGGDRLVSTACSRRAAAPPVASVGMGDLRDDVPAAYLEWLRLMAAGGDDYVIAAGLDVPVESLPTFSRIAAQKLLRAATPQNEDLREAR